MCFSPSRSRIIRPCCARTKGLVAFEREALGAAAQPGDERRGVDVEEQRVQSVARPSPGYQLLPGTFSVFPRASSFIPGLATPLPVRRMNPARSQALP